MSGRKSAKKVDPAECEQAEWEQRVKLACLLRISAYLGWEDSINTHTTMRVPGTDHHFLINPFGLRFDEVRASDLIKVDVDGKVIGKTDHPINEAGYVIHSAIHLGRSDAKCVLHTHTLAGMAVAAMADGLLPIGIFAIGFHDRLSYHSFEGASGGHNLSERARLAESLGPTNKAMILRNHGLLSAGETVEEAFVWMYRLNKACEVQMMTNGARGAFAAPSQEARTNTVIGTDAFVGGFGTGGPGELEFAAFERLMARQDASFRQ